MAHLNILATVQMPVRAAGCSIFNSAGDKLCEVASSFLAVAMADLMNLGQPEAERREEAYLATEARTRAILLNLAAGR